jgi:hypothetical protein
VIKASLLIVFAVAAAAQSQTKTTQRPFAQGIDDLDSGVTVSTKTVIEPLMRDSSFQSLGSAWHTSENTTRHMVYDAGSNSYFGYEMAVSGKPGDTRLQVSFGPLTVTAVVRKDLEAFGSPGLLNGPGGASGPPNPAPLPKFPPPQTVHEGDTIALDLMVSKDGRERMVDYIKFTTPQAHDFSIDDMQFNYWIDPPKDASSGAAIDVLINGQKTSSKVATLASHGGATFWFYFPGQGRYILSLAPHNGFVKAGTLHGARIAFHADGRDYAVRVKPREDGQLCCILGSMDNRDGEDIIAKADKAWNLYVLHDAGYRPEKALADSVVGSVDRLEKLWPGRR